MKSIRLTAVMFAVAMLVSGCASLPSRNTDFTGMSELKKLEQQGHDQIADTPSVVKIKLQKETFVVQEMSSRIPPELDKEITAEFDGAEVEKILYSVGKVSGFNVVYQPTQTRNTSSQLQEAQKTQITGPGFQDQIQTQVTSAIVKHKPVSITFKGKLSDFLQALSRASGYFFVYEDGYVVVKESEQFSISVPTYPELLKEVEANIKALGGRNVAYDKFTSAINFTCDRNALAKIKEFCRGLKNNASLVTMRVLLLNVHLDENKSAGIDWTKIALGYKAQSIANFGNQAATSQDSSSNSSSSSGIPAAQMTGTGLGLAMNATGANMFIEARNFTLNVLANFLEDFGQFRILQNANVEAMSGTKGHLDALRETPYVSEISFSALSSQITTPTQAVKTAVAKSGVELDITPYYNKAEGALTITLRISVLGVNKFVNLSAGSQIGQITQPETTRKNVETTLRMSPAQVAVIGGLVTEQYNNSSAGLPIESVLTKNYSDSKAKEELVVIVKPSVIEFE